MEDAGSIRSIQHLDGMYQKWFLDYASYWSGRCRMWKTV